MPTASATNQMPRRQDVFISYSRKDKEFVRRLHEVLSQRDREAWVDWEDIQPTEEWMQAIYGAIEGADTFIFALTPDSLASITCGREMAHAAAHNKRMVPIVARDVKTDTVPEALAKLNWIFCRDGDDFEKAADALISALDTDLKWIHAHTRLLTRAIEWDANGRNNSFVLRGEDLRSAERWLAEAGTQKERQPTALQTEYIITSRKAAARRQRITLGAVSLGFLVAVALAIMALFARQEAIKQGAKATAGRNRADDVIHFVQNNLPEKLRPIGRLDLMQDVAVAVDEYYNAMKKAEGETVDTLAGKVWVLVNQGLIDESKGHLDEALAKFHSAVPLAEKAQRLNPGSDKALEHLASAHSLVGLILQSKGEAEDESRKAQQMYEKLVERDPSNGRWQGQLAISYDAEATRSYEQQQLDAALSGYRKANTIREKLVAQAPDDSKRLNELASAHDHIGMVLLQQQQFDPALAEFRASQETVRKLTLIDPHNADWQQHLAFTYSNIGQVLQGQDDIAAALDEFRKYAQAMEKIAASDPSNAVWQRQAADGHRLIADALFKQNQFEKALTEFRKYYAAMTQLAAGDPANADVQVLVAAACAQLALVDVTLQERGDPNEASQVVQQGLAILAGLEKRGPLPHQSVELRKMLEGVERTLPQIPVENDSVISISVAKDLAAYAPRPEYPRAARSHSVTGNGICVVTVDPGSGNVTEASMVQSTGSQLLDNAALRTFRKWRFKPRTVSKVKIRVDFNMADKNKR
jgi:TonB family protein